MIISVNNPVYRKNTAFQPRILVRLKKEIITGWAPEEVDMVPDEKHKIESKKLKVYPVGSFVYAWVTPYNSTYLFDPIDDWYISTTAHDEIDYVQQGKLK